jgi:hypothetical protein
MRKNNNQQNRFQFLAKEGTSKAVTSDDNFMVAERLRMPKQVKKIQTSRSNEERKMFRKLSKQHLLENKTVLKFSE